MFYDSKSYIHYPWYSGGRTDAQAHPGVGTGVKEVQYKAYYQWVSFLLFLQVNPDRGMS